MVRKSSICLCFERTGLFAHSHGLYVLYENGDSVKVGNSDGFKPKVW